MGNASELPQALWQANLELQQRIGRLVQDCGREWMELGARAAGEGAAGLDADLRRLLRGGDWQALAALPVDAWWRQAEQRIGDGQALGQLALHVQEGFASGLLEALQDWQARHAAAWSDAHLDAGMALPPTDAWRTLVAQWESGLAAMAPVAGAGRARGGRPAAADTVPAKQPPAKSAAAKAAPKKPAAAGRPPAGKAAPKRPAPAKQAPRKRGG